MKSDRAFKWLKLIVMDNNQKRRWRTCNEILIDIDEDSANKAREKGGVMKMKNKYPTQDKV